MKINKTTCLLIIFSLSVCGYGQMDDYPFCQFLDRDDEPSWTAYMSYSPMKVEGGDKVHTFDLGGSVDFRYFVTDIGDFALGGIMDLRVFTGDGNIDLPNQLLAARFHAQWLQRTYDGFAFCVDVYPGFYSDADKIDTDHFYIPLSLSVIQSFSDNLSAILGVSIYPGFENEVDPVFGMRWAFMEYWLLDLIYPKSELSYWAYDDWKYYIGFKFNRIEEYKLSDNDGRSQIQIKNKTFFMGVETVISDFYNLRIELGYVFDDSIDFKRNSPKYDIDTTIYLKTGIVGYF